ncbi:hypothetical protein BKA62DRAFT_830607 [Auriculariales sp. MPI-PUGE-AT-0066]|nr:hypothetical protein BKA62DRAFT_830607 [Auriculariales sp. MPI-PUGE-AT-0066]
MAASVHVLAAVSAHALRSAQVTRFANVSRLALLAWDYLIMLHREKRFVWDAPFRISSVIYYTVRYPVLVFQIFNLVVTNRTAPVCKPLDQAFFTISISLPRVALCGALYYIVITTLQTGAIALYFLPQGVYSTVLNNYLTPYALHDSGIALPPRPPRNDDATNGARYANDRRSEQLPSSVSGASVIEFAAGRSNSKSQTASSAATRFGGGGVLRDFEDPPHWGVYITHARKQAGGWEERDSGTLQEEEEDHTKSTAWPMEGLTARAQAVEERLARGSVV